MATVTFSSVFDCTGSMFQIIIIMLILHIFDQVCLSFSSKQACVHVTAENIFTFSDEDVIAVDA